MKKILLAGLLLSSSLFSYDACDRYEKRVLDNNERLNMSIKNNAAKYTICMQNMLLKTYVINAYPHCKHRPETKKYMDDLLGDLIHKLDKKCENFNKKVNEQM